MKIDKKYFILADKEKTPPGREFALFVLYTLLVPFLFVLTCVPVGFAALAVFEIWNFCDCDIYAFVYRIYNFEHILFNYVKPSHSLIVWFVYLCSHHWLGYKVIICHTIRFVQ